MARYEHLPIYKAALDMAVYTEQIVANFSRYHKFTLGSELRQLAHRIVLLVIKSNNDSATWADLTGATIKMYSKISKAGTVVTPTGTTKKIRIELTKTDTKVDPGRYPLVITATLADGHIATLVWASLVVHNKQTIK